MRKIALLAILALCCLSGAAFAQDAMPTFCGTLSEADCAIVTNSQEAMNSLDSVSFDMAFNVHASNIPDMDEPVSFSLTGNGSVTGMAAVSGAADMTAFEANPGETLAKLLSDFDADLTFVLSLPEAMTAEMGSNFPSDITLQVRMVDGVGYLNLDPLQPLINEPSAKGWYGLDIANMLKTVMEQMPDMLDQLSQMSGASSMNYMEDFSNPEMLAQFVSITRTDNGSGDVATFETTVDLGALMSSPEFQDLMKQQMQAQFEMQGQTVTEDELEMGMAMSTQMMQGMVVTVTEEIGLTDNYLHSVHGSLTFDLASMMAAMGESMGGSSDSASTEEAPVFNIDFSLNYSDFNSAAAITAPEGAVVIPYQMLLQGMMGEMGGSGSSMGSGSGMDNGSSETPMETPEAEAAG